MRSGFGGSFHSGGGTGRCRLVPSPMAPDRWRSKPDVSACAASAAFAPPRIRLMRSRIRRASSKSRALAAASIASWRYSTVSFITTQRTDVTFGAMRPQARRSQGRSSRLKPACVPISWAATGQLDPSGRFRLKPLAFRLLRDVREREPEYCKQQHARPSRPGKFFPSRGIEIEISHLEDVQRDDTA